MSYKQAVLRDAPIAFFPLNGTSAARTYASLLFEYDNYQDWLNSEVDYNASTLTFTLEDLSQNGNVAAFTIGNPNFLDILPLAALSSYDTQLAGCKLNSTSEIGISNLAQIYNMFYTGTEHLSFGIEMWISFDSNPSSDNQILTLHYVDSHIFQIKANNDKIYFTINGKDKVTGASLSYTVSKQVQSWDSQVHIFAYYKDGQISISANGLYSDSITIPDNFIFSNDYTTMNNFVYNIGPSESDSHFVVNDLAFYDYVLSSPQIRSHMLWGMSDSLPQTFAKQSSAYFLDIKETNDMYAFNKDFSDPKSYSQGNLTNLVVDKSGLTLKQIASLTQAGTGTITTSNGLSVTGSASAKLNSVSDYAPLTGVSILGQINWQSNTTGNPSVILSIDNIDKDGWVFLGQSTDNKLTLYRYSKSTNYPYSDSLDILAQVPSAQSSTGTYNFGMSINNNIVTIYLSGKGSNTGYNFPVYSSINYNMYFGNQYSIETTSPLIGSIKNVSILSGYTDPSTYSNYGSVDNITATFSTGLNLSQIGTWTYSMPSSQIANIAGSRITWNSGSSDNLTYATDKYVKFDISFDYGTTWTQIKSGDPSMQLADTGLAFYTDAIIRATLFSSDSSLTNQPRAENVSIVIYKDLSVTSDAGAFILSPRSGTYTPDTYSIKKNFFNILARSQNFGIKLAETNGLSSIAQITPAGSGMPYQTVEFWYRYDNASSSAIQSVLSILSGHRNVYIDFATSTIYQSGFANVYINGVDIGGGRAITQGESYHITCVLSYPVSLPIYLGGDESLNNYSYGTYGFITMYPTAVSQTDATARYIQYLTAKASTVASVGTTNNIGTLSEYSGSGTSFNSGQPLIAYPHPVTGSI